MILKAYFQKYLLHFKKPSGTSRGVLLDKETWFLILADGHKKGIGECALFRGLSADDRPGYEAKLRWACENIHLGKTKLLETLKEFPSIQFGLETAFLSLEGNSPFEIFPSGFVSAQSPISINGLTWMGSEADMHRQIDQKIEEGFRCIKLKIGAIGFEAEYRLLKSVRKHFSSKEIELRVDANGAFPPTDALQKLNRLAELEIHSIEQPIKAGQAESMAQLCQSTKIPIALDEELIGVFDREAKSQLLKTIRPQYIILKPALTGGFSGAQEWIDLAESNGIGWWVTSALESNIGLNAIAQWTYTLKNTLPQGLGTGSLFTNNFDSPLTAGEGKLWYDLSKNWDVPVAHFK